jgi:hypothetical protein
VAIFIAAASFLFSAAQIVATSNVEQALMLAPNNGRVNSFRAEVLLQTARSPKERSVALNTAERALEAEPINPTAIRILGFLASMEQDRPRAKALMLLSTHLSRRDFGAQLWFIEDGAARGDLVQALKHYDIAMRTGTDNQELLFPVLLSALEAPEIQSNFSGYIKRNPPWLASFLSYATTSPIYPGGLIRSIVAAGGLPEGSANRTFETRLLAVIDQKGTATAMLAFFYKMPKADPKLLTSAGINSATTDRRFAPIAWYVESTPDIDASVDDRGPRDQSFHVFAPSGRRGTFATKLLFLAPGRYQLRTLQNISTDQASLYYTIHCAFETGATPLLAIAASKKAVSESSEQFSIRPGCLAQRLTVAAAGAGSGADTDLIVERIDVLPVL